MPYTPEASRPASSWPHSRERSAAASGLRELPLQKRQRGAVVLGDVEDERLARVLGDVESLGQLLARGHDLAERDQRRDPPLRRLGLALDVTHLLGKSACLSEHLERVGEARGGARPVDPHEHRRQAAPIVDSSRHRDRVLTCARGATRVALVLECTSQAREQPDTKRGILSPERPGGLLE